MTTARELLNNVLYGLRRDIVTGTSTTNSYQLLLLQYLNRAKNLIEQKWDWLALRTTATVTVTASTQTFTLSAAGAADVDVLETSRLLYEKRATIYSDEATETTTYEAGAQPQVFDTTDATEYRMEQITWEQFERLRLTDADETVSQPQYFALRVTGGYYQLGIWPMASGGRTIKARFVIPQAAIPNTSMTSYTLTIPSDQVWLRALWMAAEERGDELGRPGASLQADAEDAFYMASSREMTDTDRTGRAV